MTNIKSLIKNKQHYFKKMTTNFRNKVKKYYYK